MLPVTKRDFTIRRMCVHYMVAQYRASPTPDNLGNLWRFIAYRHSYVYDYSPIPCPMRRW